MQKTLGLLLKPAMEGELDVPELMQITPRIQHPLLTVVRFTARHTATDGASTRPTRFDRRPSADITAKRHRSRPCGHAIGCDAAVCAGRTPSDTNDSHGTGTDRIHQSAVAQKIDVTPAFRFHRATSCGGTNHDFQTEATPCVPASDRE